MTLPLLVELRVGSEAGIGASNRRWDSYAWQLFGCGAYIVRVGDEVADLALEPCVQV